MANGFPHASNKSYGFLYFFLPTEFKCSHCAVLLCIVMVNNKQAESKSAKTSASVLSASTTTSLESAVDQTKMDVQATPSVTEQTCVSPPHATYFTAVTVYYTSTIHWFIVLCVFACMFACAGAAVAVAAGGATRTTRVRGVRAPRR